jgi:type II secretory pathway component PulM
LWNLRSKGKNISSAHRNISHSTAIYFVGTTDSHPTGIGSNARTQPNLSLENLANQQEQEQVYLIETPSHNIRKWPE